MAVSVSPWWWLPEAVRGATVVWPIQTFSAPTLAPDTASRRTMPSVWAVSADRPAAPMCRSGRCQSSTRPPSDVDGQRDSDLVAQLELLGPPHPGLDRDDVAALLG